MRKKIYLLIAIMGLIIFGDKVKAYKSYNIGDVITYKNQEYYVIENSNSKQSYVTLLKKTVLSDEDITKYRGDLYFNVNQGMPYYRSDTCRSLNNKSGCKQSFNDSYVKVVLDNWANDKLDINDLIEIEGYKVRLLTTDDLFTNLGYSRNISSTAWKYTLTDDVPDWIYSRKSSSDSYQPYWTMTEGDSWNKGVYSISNNGILNGSIAVYNYQKVRPVINLYKSAIDQKGTVRYDEYEMGDIVTYGGEEYYIIEDSRSDENYVTALKKDVLTSSEIKRYKGNLKIEIQELSGGNGLVQFYSNDKCTDVSNKIGCVNNYKKSFIKNILENWSNEKIDDNDLVSIDGYKVRLIKANELFGSLGYDRSVRETTNVYSLTDDVPEWVYNENYLYWTMSELDDDSSEIFTVNNDGILSASSSYVWNYAAIRPVVNFHKSVIKKEDTQYKTYKVGDTVIYNKAEYYVIKDSGSTDNYVSLLKKDVLNTKQVNKYTGGEYISYNGKVPYTFCNISYNTSREIINDDCANDYDSSFVKKIIDGWSNDELNINDLVEINGYKARLLTVEDLTENLYYELDKYNTAYTIYQSTDDTLTKFLNNQYITYWIATPYEDSTALVFSLSNHVSRAIVSTENYVKPVINLSKCALNDSACAQQENNVSNSGLVCTTEYRTNERYNKYIVGDVINYKNDEYLVIEDSGYNKNFVTLLKVNSLTGEEIDKYYSKSSSSDDAIGTIYFGLTNGCYKDSIVKKTIDNWASAELNMDDLVEVDGYKASLFTENNVSSYNTSSWMYNSNYDYWYYSSDRYCDADYTLTHPVIRKNGNTEDTKIMNKAAIRPSINLLKTALGTETDYNIGDEVEYKGIKFYVFEASNSSKNYVVLLKADPLTNKQISLYSGIIQNNGVPFYSECTEDNNSNCTTDYEKSNVKQIVDAWAKENFTDEDLIEINKYKVRLLSVSDLINNLGYVSRNIITNEYLLSYTEETPKLVYSSGETFWTMSNYEDSNTKVEVYNKYVNPNEVYNETKVRPVINLYKCSIEGGCIYDQLEIEVCHNEDTAITTENDSKNDESIFVTVGNTLSSPRGIIMVLSGVLVICGIVIVVRVYTLSKKER